jgi:hypothetical protein
VARLFFIVPLIFIAKCCNNPEPKYPTPIQEEEDAAETVDANSEPM